MKKNHVQSFGSVCSGIEAASFVLEPLGVKPLWLSEIEDFPNRFLSQRYPDTPNLGDMNDIPEKIEKGQIEAPDLLCGGTPCQAFSLAGWKNGLNDYRGQLTLKYIEILDKIDERRNLKGQQRARFLWENVEGVLKDKTNAFGCFLAGLAGLDEPVSVAKWTNSGILKGKKRNIAWRVLDAKYFGLPQQRKRLYVIGGGVDFNPENALFEIGRMMSDPLKKQPMKKDGLSLFEDYQEDTAFDGSLRRNINGEEVEIFRTYTDCLYAAYGTKWNGNAAAFNGSLFVSQNDRLRRLTPIECERLMGFPDNYTDIPDAKLTSRFRAIGNSWAVNVVRWVLNRLVTEPDGTQSIFPTKGLRLLNEFTPSENGDYLNSSCFPYDYAIKNFLDFIDVHPSDKLYLSPSGCAGILRRKTERNVKLGERFERALTINTR